MRVKLIALTQPVIPEIKNQQELIEYAGRTCTNTVDCVGQNTTQFIEARLKQGHTSIVEHVSFTFEITGISRACAQQLTRHRIASYSMQSQRYVDQSNFEIILPDEIYDNPDAFNITIDTIAKIKRTYSQLRNLGISKEDARIILPLCATTTLIATFNTRSLINFFELRCDKAAQAEIRKLAELMHEIVKEYLPNVFG